MRSHRIARTVLPAAMVVCAAALAAAAETAAPKTVPLPPGLFDNVDPSETVRYLSSIQSRVAGSAGCDEAADFIRKRFEEIGLADVQEHSFSIPSPNERGGSLEIPGGASVLIHTMWPNLGRAPKTISEGLPGHLIYAGAGDTASLAGLDLADAAALMDFNCSTQWLNVAQFGTAAIIFIEPATTFRKEAEDKFLNIPASIPRYYITRENLATILGSVLGTEVEASGLPAALAALNELSKTEGKTGEFPKTAALVKADVLWENRAARNIVGTIVGTDPDLRKETVIIESFYDSISAVPVLAPGAESSCGIATLLEVAEALKANPPKRTVRLLATSGHFQALAGIRQWCRDYYVWESLMVGYSVGQDNRIFAPPADVWPTPEEIAALKPGETQPPWKPEQHPVLYVTLDLSSLSKQLGIFYKGHFYDLGGSTDETIYRKKFSDIGNNCMSVAGEITTAAGADASLVSCIDPIRGRDWRSYVLGQIALDNEVPLLYGKAEVGLVTVNDSRPLVDTPLDTVDRMNLDAVLAQAKLVTGLLWDITNRSFEIPPADVLAAEMFLGVTADSLISFLPGSPLPDSLIVTSLSAQKTIMGVRGSAMTMTDQQGQGLVVGMIHRWPGPLFFVCRVDPRDGTLEYVAKRQVIGVKKPSFTGKDWAANRAIDAKVPLFECAATLIFDIVDQLNYRSLPEDQAKVFDANTDAEPRNFAKFFGSSSITSSNSEPCGVVFVERGEERIKIIASAGIVGAKYTLLNATGSEDAEKSTGIGFPVESRENVIPMTTYQAAKDMWLLDEYRLKTLQATGVRNKRAQTLHDDLARKRLDEAQIALEAKDYTAFLNAAREAWAFEARAYPNVQGTSDDVIKGLIFYLAVLLPFAVFAERLVFTFADIRKRLLAIAVLFGLIYVILSRVHPGFQLSTNPVIILAGFFMLVLGLVTIGLLLGKFNTQMALMREKSGTWHRTDVARGSAAGAAFMLGISNLRRRKVRTALTCLTLVLLTFTVLSFTSFETNVAPNVVPTDYDMSYKGVLIRRRDWSPLEAYAANTLRDYFRAREGAVVVERSWYSAANNNEYMQLDVARADTATATLQCRGLLGLDPQETKLIPWTNYAAYGDFLDPRQPGYPNVCIISRDMAEGGAENSRMAGRILCRLLGDFTASWGTIIGSIPGCDRSARASAVIAGVQRVFDNTASWNTVLANSSGTSIGLRMSEDSYKGTTVRILGKELRVVGVFDPPRFRETRDLDYEELTPVDYQAQAAMELSKGKSQQTGGVQVTDTGELRMQPEEKPPDLYQHIDPSAIVIVPNSFLQKFNTTTVRSIAVGLPTLEEAEIVLLLKEYVPRSRLILFAGIGDAVRLFSSRDTLSAKGMQALFLPIAIAALIVFNTMLGSVYERIREIAVYTSCGLAPVHVAALFLAESSVFATMGAVIGYLLGQGVAKIITVTGRLEGINLNYSSVSAVYTILLVVVVVLLSTLYPARKAVQLSVPDETKKMKLPKPKGDVWEFDFPFTVSSVEALGLSAFLYDYFASHDEDSGGVFQADSFSLTEAATPDGPRYTLESSVWVEPMDMGISQKVVLETLPPAPNDPICTIKFTIHRLSGEVETWRRMNLGFLKAIRKQMLIWRLVDGEHKVQYDTDGKKLLGKSVEV
ncbi:MAG TPA: FtsX-like permease family protein [Planctomycetota bacterium]|nr:FtsX-like permease family protein [Planctomycetota bacterium]